MTTREWFYGRIMCAIVLAVLAVGVVLVMTWIGAGYTDDGRPVVTIGGDPEQPEWSNPPP